MNEKIKKEVIITRYNDQILVAFYIDGKAIEFFIYDSDSLEIGDMYIGKVKNIVDNIKAAFVEIKPGVIGYYSLTVNDAHFYASKSQGRLKIGDEILVQVERGPIKTKAAVLSSHFQFTGKYIVLIGNERSIGISKKIVNEARREELRNLAEKWIGEENLGIIFRTDSRDIPNAVIESEFQKLIGDYNNIMSTYKMRTCYSRIRAVKKDFLKYVHASFEEELSVVTDQLDLYNIICTQDDHSGHSYHYYEDSYPLVKLKNIETQLTRALSKNVWLRSGASLVIEPTEALTVVDVNTGKTEIHKNNVETFYRINMEAAVEIFKQIRLRNISGIIIIDFINMQSKAYQDALMQELHALAKKDPVQTTVVDLTPLGLVEITRKRTYRPLFEQISRK